MLKRNMSQMLPKQYLITCNESTHDLRFCYLSLRIKFLLRSILCYHFRIVYTLMVCSLELKTMKQNKNTCCFNPIKNPPFLFLYIYIFININIISILRLFRHYRRVFIFQDSRRRKNDHFCSQNISQNEIMPDRVDSLKTL